MDIHVLLLTRVTVHAWWWRLGIGLGGGGYHYIICNNNIVCLYSASFYHRKTLSVLLAIFSLSLLFIHPSQAQFWGYTRAVMATHKFTRVNTQFCSVSPEVPPFCLQGSTVRDLSLPSASCLRESVL